RHPALYRLQLLLRSHTPLALDQLLAALLYREGIWLRLLFQCALRGDFGPRQAAGPVALPGFRVSRQRLAALSTLLGILPVLRCAREADRMAAQGSPLENF